MIKTSIIENYQTPEMHRCSKRWDREAQRFSQGLESEGLWSGRRRTGIAAFFKMATASEEEREIMLIRLENWRAHLSESVSETFMDRRLMREL